MTADRGSERVAIVNGGSSAVGFRIAVRLIVDGVQVVLFDRDGAVENAEALGADVLGIRIDMGNEQEMDSALNGVVDRFSRLDFLANHAGAQVEPAAVRR